MTAEFGLFFLILALATALLQSSFLLPSEKIRQVLSPSLSTAAWLQALCVTLALATLINVRLQSDFSVTNVVEHSNRTLPTLYKIAGSWGNHEGSMLLWAWVLSTFGAVMAMRHAPHQQSLARFACSTQSVISAGALLFIILTSNPFARVFPPMADGQALNPLLQDIALAMHPPLLYLGYVGFSMVFSLAVAAMLQGRMGREWAQAAHPWILAAWSALTFGIGLGSWWAYRVLGWGGFWFWDPVENASLLPWLSGTALLHANIVLKKRGLLAQWVLLLSIITFGMSLLGTFLVRSGALVSVHSFASDPQRGLFILLYITLLLGWALSLFASRGYRMASEGQMEPLSREGIIVINNLFLLTACATILLGTLYPMLAEALVGKSISVGAPYFNITALPLLTIPLFFAGLAPFMPWNHASLRPALRKSLPCFLAALAAAAIVIAAQMPDALLAAAGIALSVWLSAASVRWLLMRQSAKNAYSVFLGHLGAALVIAGITGAGLWKQEHEQWMSVGQSVTLAGYELTLTDIQSGNSANYQATSAAFDVKASGQLIATLTPEYRVYSIRNSGSSVVSIYPSLLGDLYGVIGEADKDRRKISVRLYYNPMIGLLWAGFVLMALGGLTAIIQGITKGTKGTRHEP